MAWRIHEQVVKGELDNRQQGRVVGKLWLFGRPEPILLELEGDAHRDMAGCRLTFSNPKPKAGEPSGLNAMQRGAVGDMTVSRKVRVPDVPEAEWMRLYSERKPIPTHLANGLYLEWFSEANGRVVIEAVDYHVRLSEPVWRMTREQEKKQAELNQAAMGQFMDRLGPRLEDADDGDTNDTEPASDKPMDEFQWEKFLKESDARTDKYGQLLEKYEGHPQKEQLVARAMGWTWLDEALDTEKRGGQKIGEPVPDPFEDLEPLEPDPKTEGTDWVLDKHGHPQHPLTMRMTEVAMAMFHHCKALGLLVEDGDPELRDMIFQSQMTSAKLAGGLNSLCYRGEHADAGFVVAYLKRALKYLNLALTATARVEQIKRLPADDITRYRADLLSIRQDILSQMQRYRSMLND